MVDTQHFCLRWNNYQSSITSAFENLRDDEDFVDVTLACDGKSLKAHRVVLSACSPYFRELLKSTPCKHPVIVLQDVAYTDLHALVEFIYHGEVNVHQRSLSSFLKTAEVLRVSGLTQNDDAQGVQSLAARAAAVPQTPPPQPATPSYCDKLEEALLSHSAPPTVQQLLRRSALPPPLQRRVSRSSDNSPDPAKRPRHDNNNTEQASHMPQITATDFSTKNHSLINNTRVNHSTEGGGNNGNGISNSSSSPSPRLMDEVKHEPMELLCGAAADIDRSNESPPHSHHRPHLEHHLPRQGGPLSRGSSAEADDRTPPPLPQPPFLSPNEAKLFATGSTFNFTMAALADHSPLTSLGSPALTPEGLAGTSQGKKLFSCHLCGKVLCSKASLKRHIADKHAERQEEYRCAICERVYCSRNSLMTHIYTYHKSRPGELDIKFF